MNGVVALRFLHGGNYCFLCSVSRVIRRSVENARVYTRSDVTPYSNDMVYE